MTPQEREARLRAARRLQDDIYQGIGATDRPDVDGRGPTSAAGGRVRDAARDSATSMTRAGTQPLRDLLAQPDDRTARMAARDADYDEDDSQVMGKPSKMGSGKQGSAPRRPPAARSMGAPAASEDEREAREEFRRFQAERRARAAGDIPKTGGY